MTSYRKSIMFQPMKYSMPYYFIWMDSMTSSMRAGPIAILNILLLISSLILKLQIHIGTI